MQCTSLELINGVITSVCSSLSHALHSLILPRSLSTSECSPIPNDDQEELLRLSPWERAREKYRGLANGFRRGRLSPPSLWLLTMRLLRAAVSCPRARQEPDEPRDPPRSWRGETPPLKPTVTSTRVHRSSSPYVRVLEGAVHMHSLIVKSNHLPQPNFFKYLPNSFTLLTWK